MHPHSGQYVTIFFPPAVANLLQSVHAGQGYVLRPERWSPAPGSSFHAAYPESGNLCKLCLGNKVAESWLIVTAAILFKALRAVRRARIRSSVIF
jgi:hypothetical protein